MPSRSGRAFFPDVRRAGAGWLREYGLSPASPIRCETIHRLRFPNSILANSVSHIFRSRTSRERRKPVSPPASVTLSIRLMTESSCSILTNRLFSAFGLSDHFRLP